MIPIYEQAPAEYITIPISAAIDLLNTLSMIKDGEYEMSIQQSQQVDNLCDMLVEKVRRRSCPV